MGLNKRLINVGAEAAEAAFDPLQNFETVTYTGTNGTQKITGYIRKGAAFNGSSSSIVTTLDNSQLPVSSSWSCSCWINSSSFSNATNILGMEDGSSPYNGWSLYQNTSGVLYPMVNGNSQGSGTTLTANQWYNVILTYSGTVLKFYVNGSQIGTDITISISTPSSNFDIGNLGIYSVYNGKVDQVRIFNRVLSTNNNGVNEIDELYKETYADADKSTTDIFGDGSGVALYELDEDANDTAGAGTNGKFGDAAFFNGSSSFIDTNAKIPASLNFSISFWLNTTSTASNQYIFSTKGNYQTNGWWIITESGTIKYGEGNGVSNATTQISPASTYADGSWHHIVVTRASGGTVNMYIDGSQVITNSSVGTYYMTSSVWQHNLHLGRYAASNLYHFNGSLDDVRIYSDVLTSNEVGYIYNNTTASIPSDNLEAYYKFDGDALDETSNDNDGTATNVSFGYDGTPTSVNFLGMAFQPDLVWIKGRSNSSNHALFDSIRGNTKRLESDNTNQESTYSYFSSFDTNGFTVGNQNAVNTDGRTYVAWCWKAGGTAVSNTDGDITSQVSANQAAGFSIVKYTGTNDADDVGHGLSQAPDLVIAKTLDSSDSNSNWIVYASPLSGQRGALNLDISFAASTTHFREDPDATVLKLSDNASSNVNRDGEDHIAYCFHSVDGYQKVGSYTGKNATNTVTTGFQPRFLMVKLTSATNGNWVIYDNVRSGSNPRTKKLAANESDIENDSASLGGDSLHQVNFTSTGFQLLETGGGVNTNKLDETYIYLAIA